MSGRGSGQDDYALARADERGDVIAFLLRRWRACETMEQADAGQAERAGIMKRQLSVLIDDIRGGMHEGEAEAAPGAEINCANQEG